MIKFMVCVFYHHFFNRWGRGSFSLPVWMPTSYIRVPRLSSWLQPLTPCFLLTQTLGSRMGGLSNRDPATHMDGGPRSGLWSQPSPDHCEHLGSELVGRCTLSLSCKFF